MRRLPLSQLVPAAIFLVGTVLLAVIIGADLWSSFRRTEQTMERQARVLGIVLSAAMESAFRRNDLGEARSNFGRVQGDREIEIALLLDETDRVMFASRLVLRGAPLAQTPLADARPEVERARGSLVSRVTTSAGRDRVTSVFPVRLHPGDGEIVSSRVGVLLMRHRLDGEKRVALAGAANRLAALAALLLATCIAVWLGIRRLLLGRIERLTEAAEGLAEDRPEDPIDVRGHDELASLARALHTTGERLRSRTAALEASRAFLDAALDAVPANIAVLDSRGVIVAVNESWRRFGAENGLDMPRDGVGADYIEICERAGRDDASRVAQAIRDAFVESQVHLEIEYPCHSPDVERWFELRLTKFEVNDTVQLLMTHQDVTGVKHAAQALRLGEERYRTLYDHNPAMFFTVDGQCRIVSANEFGARELGYRVEEIVGRPVTDLYEASDRARLREHISGCFRDRSEVHRWESAKLRKDGARLWVRETGRAVVDADGHATVLIVCEDVTETHELSRELAYQASHDALTGLINRHEFERRLRDAVDSAHVDETQHVLCYFDLDQFKVINDTCGHIAGDELLRQLGRVFQGCVRRSDTLARLGGDEFAILMERCPLGRGVALAETLRDTVEDFRFGWEGRSFSVGLSIGIVQIGPDSESAGELLREADAACYAAKDAGRNRVHVYRPDDEVLARRQGEMHWVSRIQSALDHSRLELYYQSIVPVDGGGAATGWHYELLVRMRDEAGELVPPGAFLPAAERYNLAARIDRRVVDEALDWLRAHPEHVAGLYLCSINLSGQSLADDAFLDHVSRALDRTGVPPDRLCFEVTETAAITNLSRAMTFIRRLTDIGCSFALDDFGSGLSSFAYLKHLQVDFLKIDGLFVRDMGSDPIDAAMVASINDIGHVMGKRTIAEFVESEAIMRRIAALGVDFAQGYGIAVPRPLSDLPCEPAPGRPANANRDRTAKTTT